MAETTAEPIERVFLASVVTLMLRKCMAETHDEPIERIFVTSSRRFVYLTNSFPF